MRVKKCLIVGLLSVGVGVMSCAPAPAGASGQISPDRVEGSAPVVQVSWSGLPVNDTLLVSQCDKSDVDATFDPATDCSQATYQTFLTGPDGKGSGPFTLFGGNEPNGEEWGCGDLSTNVVTVETCFIRFSVGTITETSSDEFFPVRFGAPDESETTAPRVVVAAGATAALVGGCGFVLRARRRPVTGRFPKREETT